jgi:hypothetical protein
MHARPVRGRIRPALPALWAAALLGVCCSGTAIAAGSGPRSASSPTQLTTLSGTWSGHYHGALSGTFTLRWRQSKSKLTGSIKLSTPRGTYSISGSVRGKAIKFGAVGAGATYTGSVSGKSMSGSYRTPQGGGTWGARKTG